MDHNQIQKDKNIERIKVIYHNIIREKLLDKIFEHKEDAKELDFNEGDLH